MSGIKQEEFEHARLDYLAFRKEIGGEEISLGKTQTGYTEFAAKYEKTVTTLGRISHVIMANNVASLYPPAERKLIKILDVGAGTGLEGNELKLHGFVYVDALEPNEAMLNEAKKRDIYNKYIVDFFNENQLYFEKDSYDVITGCGVFSDQSAHMRPEVLKEMIRIVKPGGYIFFSGRSLLFDADSVGGRLEILAGQLETEGKWKKIARDQESGYNNLPGTHGVIWQYLVL